MSDRPAALEPSEPTGHVAKFPVKEHPGSDPVAARSHSASVGNCDRYASNSAGFVLFMIDCQNRFSCAALAGGEGGCGAVTAGGVDGVTRATAVRIVRPELGALAGIETALEQRRCRRARTRRAHRDT